MNTTSTDRIEKGEWFQVDMSGVEFRAGQPVHAKMTYPGYEGKPFEMVVERIEPERLFSFRWHRTGSTRTSTIPASR